MSANRGQTVLQLMKQRKKTVQDIARVLHKSPSTVRRMCKRDHLWFPADVISVSIYLRKDLFALFSEEAGFKPGQAGFIANAVRKQVDEDILRMMARAMILQHGIVIAYTEAEIKRLTAIVQHTFYL